MKKVVAFVGSPRKKGNVSSIINQILKGAGENGLESKVFYLNDMNIRGCQSCLYCREHEGCCLKDDMQEVYEAVKEADYIIIGSPIYICQVSGQTKLLLDRLYPLTDHRHKPRFGDKKLIYVYTQAAPFSFIFQKYIRYNSKILKPMGLHLFKTFVATKAFTPDALKGDAKVMEKAYRLGKRLV